MQASTCWSTCAPPLAPPSPPPPVPPQPLGQDQAQLKSRDRGCYTTALGHSSGSEVLHNRNGLNFDVISDLGIQSIQKVVFFCVSQ